MERSCVRCGSRRLESYGQRLYCATCGMTFHHESNSVDEEMERRRGGQNPERQES